MTHKSQLKVEPKDDDSSLSLSKVRSDLIARGRRDAAILLGPPRPALSDRLSAIRQLAEEGDAKAQFCLAYVCQRGNKVPQDHAEAVRWYRLAADQGHTGAQYDLGFSYMMGELGLPHDYAEAVRWFRLAADQEDLSAQYYVGLLYEKGRGVAQNDAEAARWFRKAADRGVAPAQYRLGVMYNEGKGVPQDYVQAHMWFNLAAAGGEPEASRGRRKVAKQMTSEDIAEAQRLARNWKVTRGADE